MTESNRFQCLIFDLGGVLLNIDYHRTAKAFKELGVANFDDLYSQAAQSGIFDQLEIGKISPMEFRDAIRKITDSGLSNEEIDQAWNSMLLDFPIHRMEFLEKVSSKHQVLLMSNTNKIHIEAFTNIIEKDFGINRFEATFDKIYYSSSIGKRKPHKETFEWILKENNLKAEHCWFVDDSHQHIIGARQAGIESHFLLPEEDVTQILSL